MDFIVDSIHKGGPFMWPILLCAVFALAIAFERLYFILFRANINGTAFMAQVQKNPATKLGFSRIAIAIIYPRSPIRKILSNICREGKDSLIF